MLLLPCVHTVSVGHLLPTQIQCPQSKQLLKVIKNQVYFIVKGKLLIINRKLLNLNTALGISRPTSETKQEDSVNNPCSAELSVQKVIHTETSEMKCDLGNWIKVTYMYIQSQAGLYRGV